MIFLVTRYVCYADAVEVLTEQMITTAEQRVGRGTRPKSSKPSRSRSKQVRGSQSI